jgi:hypothetical protein
MEATPIPAYDLEEFRQLVTKSPDLLTRQPCVVRGFTEKWIASKRWGDLDELSKMFGHLPVTAGAPQFVTHKQAKMCQVMTDFGTYLQYLKTPERVEELFEGKWSKGNAQLLRELNLPLYSGNLRLVRHSKEEVFSQLDPILPEPLEHFNNEIPYFYQSGNHVWLYVSRKGALTPLHQDNNAVIAYLAQMRGEKRAILYSPEDKPHFYNPDVGYMDPLNPNEAEFPTWRKARPWTGLLKPGELLIWGPNWAHHVVTLSDSTTVSFDFINSLNLRAYAKSVDWRDELGRFAKKNADMIRTRIPDRRVHDALVDAPLPELGRELMICVLRNVLTTSLSERSAQVKRELLAALEESAQPVLKTAVGAK